MSTTAAPAHGRRARARTGTPSGTGRASTPQVPAEGSAPAKRPSFVRGLLSGVVTVLLVALIALAVALAVVPRVMGGAALTVLSGSMEPTYSPGDVVVPVPQDRYSVGDVVTFQPVSGEATLITHRVVAVQSSANGVSYVTRGDANGADDAPIVPQQIMGRVLYSVPYVGHVTNAAGSRNAVIVTVAGLGLIGYGAYQLGSGLRRRRPDPSPGVGAATAASASPDPTPHATDKDDAA